MERIRSVTARGPAALVLAFLMAPYLVLLARFDLAWNFTAAEIGRSLWQTSLQAVASAVVCLLFGAWGALGLLWARRRKFYPVLEWLCLAPAVLPVIFVISAYLWASRSLGLFSPGVLAVIIVHAFGNAGLAAILLKRLFESKASGWAELAHVEGACPWRFWTTTIAALKADLVRIAFGFFSLFFVTLAVPLILGGGRILPLEVLMLEKIQIDGDMGSAMSLAMGQSLILVLVTGAWGRSEPAERHRFAHWLGLTRPEGLWLLTGVGLGILGFIALAPLSAKSSSLSVFAEHGDALQRALVTTLRLGFFVGGLTYLLLGLATCIPSRSRIQRWLLGLSAPSTVLVGLALTTVGPSSGMVLELKLAVGLSLLACPFLYRWAGQESVARLEGQIQAARLMGATDLQIYARIVWPQTAATLGWLSGVAAVWASGDYALSGLIASESVTLGMWVQQALAAYRWEAAHQILGLVAVSGVLSFSLWTGVGRVFGAESRS